MKWLESVFMALKSIGSNKVRSALTMLGIIIGVSSVITMVSLVQGSTREVTDQFKSMGTNNITVSIMTWGSTRSVDPEDMVELADDNIDIIEGLAPLVNSGGTVKVGRDNISTRVQGTNKAYGVINNHNVTQGRFINVLDTERRLKVALIGSYVANELFNGKNPLGETIKIDGQPFTVVGLLKEKAGGAQHSDDDVIIIPYTTALRLTRAESVDTYFVQAKNAETVDVAIEKLESFLLETLKDPNFFSVYNQAEFLENLKEVQGTLTLMLGGIAGISLLVGGIGIMNIMLVSVTERTKEIGIRKALGAKRRNILQQFLIESVVVSSIGGILGILSGIGIAKLIGNFMKINASPSLFIIMLSFSFSAVIGVFFGLYPANKASKLNPIQALRVE
ncbi:ABC transporter permease [Sporosalibacterium faouarense]|uniref:ABC transporter permease n=1 Tax=Sporosalibacterium faouarense TaxID=516123 RepID=UPI00141CE0AF|nr:FtsX-like permease family protein [Bacillota bacterium]